MEEKIIKDLIFNVKIEVTIENTLQYYLYLYRNYHNRTYI